jgi:hypothetical protein
VSDVGMRGVQVIKWANMRSAGNVGKPYACPNFADKSVHVTGAFYGATVTIQGSNEPDDPSSWVTLNDTGGTALTFTSAAIKQIRENSYWVRPSISGGAAGTELTVYLLIETTR